MTTAIIPSRFGSKRFNGKPLAPISGKPMIQRVYEQAKRAESISDVIVATDNDKIFEAVEKFGGRVVKTSDKLRSGTDRVSEAASMLGIGKDEIIVNIQGDQPAFDPGILDQLVLPFEEDPALKMTSLARKITDKSEIDDPKNVKVIFDKNHFAIYFSRAAIPFPRDRETMVVYYKHLGFYAYKKDFLDNIASLDSGMYENIEKLEQLRVLEHGFKIKISVTRYDAPGVDIPEDIKTIEQYLLNNPDLIKDLS